MADPTVEETTPELGTLVRVVYKGNASIGDQTGEIMLAPGPNGESRTLALGGSTQDVLVTAAELHMLTAQYQIEVVEEQPELSDEELAEQMPPPLDDAAAGQIPATLPNENPDAELSAEEQTAAEAAAQQPVEGDQLSAGGQPAQEPAPAAPADEQPPQAPAEPPQPQVPQQTPEGDGALSPSPAIEQVAPSEPASEQNPTTTSTP